MPTPSYIAAIDIGGTNLRTALARTDLPPDQSIIARISSSTLGIKDPQQIVNMIKANLQLLLDQHDIQPSQLKSIAAGAPGITNTDTGVVIVTSYLLGWRDVPFRQLLQDALQIPAAVDNDGKLAALGESWAGAAQDHPNFVFLAIGTGVSAGIILNRQIHRGTTFTAGEIGYMLLPTLTPDPAPRGKPGHLESALGGSGIQSLWQSQWSARKSQLPQSLTPTQIFDAALPTDGPEPRLAGGGDALAKSILDGAARLTASLIYNISLILNVPLFVLGGGIGTHPALIAATNAQLTSWGTRINPTLLPSSLGPDAQLYGAIKLALDTADSQMVVGVQR